MVGETIKYPEISYHISYDNKLTFKDFNQFVNEFDNIKIQAI